MFTTGSKLFFGMAALAFVATPIYILGSSGAQGELMGTWMLVSLLAVVCFIGGMVAFFRDADPSDAEIQAASAADAEGASPFTEVPHAAWPAIIGLGVLVAAIGLVLDRKLFILGLLVAGVGVIEWMVQAWADRSSADPVYNARMRGKIMRPFEFPVIGAIAGGFVVLGFSRILLAASKVGAIVVFAVVAGLVFVCAIVVSTRPRVGKALTTGLLGVGGVAVLAAGIAGAAAGEREFETHEHCEADFATRTVSAKSALVAKITVDGEEADQTVVEMPHANTVSLQFINEGDEETLFLVTSDGGAVLAETCPVGEGESQLVVLRIPERGVYHFGTEEHPDLGELRVL